MRGSSGTRAIPEGYVKTSFEITESAKKALEDLKRALKRGGQVGVSEAAIVEALILAAKRTGVDDAVLARVLKGRKTVQRRADPARR
ncbi:MAG TPA: hypothetical protein VHX17_11795 [Candidatus Cybelea sp.]|jgi:ubiquinone/menaquinone biosynthesis C-methylase UbiE|nr:hypothetical protein [Candidatus Cybelea sp.]